MLHFGRANVEIEMREKFQELADLNPDALLVDGLNEAIIGFGHQFTNAPVAIYDYDKCIEIFMKNKSAKEKINRNVSVALLLHNYNKHVMIQSRVE